MLVWDNEINNGTRTITFPMAFPVKCYDIIAMHHYENNVGESFLCAKIRNITATNSIVDFYDLTRNNNFYGRMLYFAIGK